MPAVGNWYHGDIRSGEALIPIATIIDQNDTSPACLAAVLFQCLRAEIPAHAGPNPGRKVARRALAAAKDLMPDVSDAAWDAGVEYLLDRSPTRSE